MISGPLIILHFQDHSVGCLLAMTLDFFLVNNADLEARTLTPNVLACGLACRLSIYNFLWDVPLSFVNIHGLSEYATVTVNHNLK